MYDPPEKFSCALPPISKTPCARLDFPGPSDDRARQQFDIKPAGLVAGIKESIYFLSYSSLSGNMPTPRTLLEAENTSITHVSFAGPTGNLILCSHENKANIGFYNLEASRWQCNLKITDEKASCYSIGAAAPTIVTGYLKNNSYQCSIFIGDLRCEGVSGFLLNNADTQVSKTSKPLFSEYEIEATTSSGIKLFDIRKLNQVKATLTGPINETTTGFCRVSRSTYCITTNQSLSLYSKDKPNKPISITQSDQAIVALKQDAHCPRTVVTLTANNRMSFWNTKQPEHPAQTICEENTFDMHFIGKENAVARLGIEGRREILSIHEYQRQNSVKTKERNHCSEGISSGLTIR